jgi:hypothetical protein
MVVLNSKADLALGRGYEDDLRDAIRYCETDTIELLLKLRRSKDNLRLAVGTLSDGQLELLVRAGTVMIGKLARELEKE